ncbi:common pilus major fimbrillin subunit EcpA [Hafnia paralvei]|uniref:common pilus major fimbrillin subunit EcpA n=1 Tax=Hafnia paralvei TaxID=546367 RepID=UPI0010353DE2|nr:common pilus major fimbrillin subunit EcpA [Hafnia paralvei]MCK2182334.1 common pilus major fimbrillin subunit EcpA [Hafnia paralvei]TBL58057.1 fimbrial protein [Hafnia paralvei]
MKQLLLVTSLVSIFAAANAMADVTATATASWDATATKDTSSVLVVTPLSSLTFQYAEGLNAFNTQEGAFDVTIQGQESATDFELSARVISKTLINSSGDPSTLDVGVAWNGSPLTETDTTLTSSSLSNGLDNLTADGAYNGAGRVSDQSSFNFNISSATSDGSTPVSDYSELPDGYWAGDVKVQFTATWTTPV